MFNGMIFSGDCVGLNPRTKATRLFEPMDEDNDGQCDWYFCKTCHKELLVSLMFTDTICRSCNAKPERKEECGSVVASKSQSTGLCATSDVVSAMAKPTHSTAGITDPSLQPEYRIGDSVSVQPLTAWADGYPVRKSTLFGMTGVITELIIHRTEPSARVDIDDLEGCAIPIRALRHAEKPQESQGWKKCGNSYTKGELEAYFTTDSNCWWAWRRDKYGVYGATKTGFGIDATSESFHSWLELKRAMEAHV